ncbi:hypothetical protein [Agriterribacter sp.]|uniref:hypothetical protein n=1 Tax=Agriterribacter sp. TaxID=2821509 RepID=UPI002C06FF06|nr:hypothetical protein [Agriterribacter sp.]HRP57012.1 hypothetical protein [Agriterribacter sp.]
MKQQTSAPSEPLHKGKTLIDYKGKIIYVGIDVHQKAGRARPTGVSRASIVLQGQYLFLNIFFQQQIYSIFLFLLLPVPFQTLQDRLR